jgi:hypothetical protein
MSLAYRGVFIAPAHAAAAGIALDAKLLWNAVRSLSRPRH